MPEWGGLPIPKKLLARGVRDMVRISDARMSGTHYGTCILHVSPESAVGGPLALVHERRQDRARHRRAHACTCDVTDAELARRRAAWHAAAARPYARGFTRLYQRARDAGPRGLRLRLPAGRGARRPSRSIY